MKYDRYENEMYGSSGTEVKVESILNDGETVLWKGKPKKSTFVLEKCLAMAPFALLWLLFDGGIITFISIQIAAGEFPTFLIPIMAVFFLLHLMPVWIWLSQVLTASKRWKNTEYYVTDRRIIIKGGFIAANFVSVKYTEISHVSVHVGVLDKMTGVGDVVITSCIKGANIIDIQDPYKVFKLIDRAVVDIQADMQYPNALRPDENPGYNTSYHKHED